MMTKRNLSRDSKTLLAYQEDIKNCEILSAAKEQELGERILQGDTDARNKLIEGYLALVFKCANDYLNPKVPMDELVAAGNLGLTIAASRFDPSKSRRFYFYAKHYIKDAILKAIYEYNATIHIPLGVDKKFHFMSINPNDDEHDGDEDWVRPLIDTIAAAPESWEDHKLMQNLKREAQDILGPHFTNFEANLLLDYAQKLYDGYTIDDLAFEYRVPIRKMKALINVLQLKAKTLHLKAAFQKAA